MMQFPHSRRPDATVYKVTPAEARDWNLCGRYYVAAHLEPRLYAYSCERELGNATHDLVNAYHRALHAGTPDLDAIMERTWRPGRFPANVDCDARDEARSMLHWYALYHADETCELLDSERPIKIDPPRKVAAGRFLLLSGRIDRLARLTDGSIEVLDFKTRRDLPSAFELRNDLGTTIYHLLAEHRFPGVPITLAQLSLRSGALVELQLSAEEVNEGKNRVREMVRQIAERDFSCARCEACAFCPVNGTCTVL